MVNRRGLDRNSFIAGPSTRNQRIERLWRDVFRCALVTFYYTFYALEQNGVLNLENEFHMFILHTIFLPRINHCLMEFKALFNNHKLPTENNRTPNQIWVEAMLNPDNPLASDTLIEDDIEPEYYGEDPSAPFPFSEQNNVVVEPPKSDIENLSEIIHRPSSEMGLDIFMEALQLLDTLL